MTFATIMTQQQNDECTSQGFWVNRLSGKIQKFRLRRALRDQA